MSSENDAASHLRRGQQLARVCASQGERARVILDGAELSAVVAGAVIYAADSATDLPATGDWVAVRRVEPELALIEQVLPRRSKIARRAAGRRNEEQVLAANVDLALIVCGLDGDFNIRRLERYLAIAKEGGVEPVIVLNKADVCTGADAALDEARRTTRAAKALAISARTGLGCEAIDGMLGPGVTAVLLGSSGAGKSTLLNRIAGGDVHKTASVRESDARGRHTTTARELIELPCGGALIDTPGLREIQLWGAGESIAAVFDDIAELAAQCRFGDCTHSAEPGCAVRGAVDAGRLDSFHKLRREADRVSGLLTEKQRWRSVHKAARQFYKIRGR
ncbi:MAG: ribosome small subunit-dependent GTPase A [Acidobacteriia bacterium]|nr:ribosome small subunit-dependent GTPase A [Terriglobia bacterium]